MAAFPSKRNSGILSAQKKEARRLGVRALSTGIITFAVYGVISMIGIPYIGTIAAIGGLALTAKRTWEWLKYRGKWGLRF